MAMARWTVGQGDHVLIIEVTDEREIKFDIPRGPVVVDADTAQEYRIKIGAAIGLAQCDPA